MSGDKFWEQWSSTPNPGGEKPADSHPAPGAPSIDADALAAWLKAEPHDPNAPASSAVAPGVPVPPPAPPAAPAPFAGAASDLNALWPPAAPVDPFTGIQKSTGAPLPAEWDLGFDQPPTTPPAPPPPPAVPASAVPGAPAGLNDFSLDLGSGAPAAAQFPAPAGGPASPTPAYIPPPSPTSPPPEALQAPPLRLTVSIGRKTTELTVTGEALIGRPDTMRGLNPEIDLRQDDAVSRRHAKIFFKNGAYILTDLNSTNGTRHNHQWLPAEQEVVLRPGDEIEVGEQTLIRILEAPQPHA